MYLHLGRDVVVPYSSVIAVVDMDTATSSRHTRAFLSAAEKQNRVLVVTDELPRSAVICGGKNGAEVYICQISSKTLLRRATEGMSQFMPDGE